VTKQDEETIGGYGYTTVKLAQSVRYKTIAVIKRHKITIQQHKKV